MTRAELGSVFAASAIIACTLSILMRAPMVAVVGLVLVFASAAADPATS